MMRESPVLVLASDWVGSGGIERVSYDLLQTLGAFPMSMEWASLWGGVGQDLGRPRPGGRCIWQGPPNLGAGAPRLQKMEMAAAVAARSSSVTYRAIVCAHARLLPLAAAVAAVQRAPLSSVAHGTECWSPFHGVKRAALRRATQIWSVSRITDDQLVALQGLSPSRIARLVLCPPSSVLPRRSTDTRVPGNVLAVARLTRKNAYKGIDVLLDSWPLVLRGYGDAELTIVGDGDLREQLVRQARHLDAGHSVHFLGRVPDERLRNAYADASVFCMPARARFHPMRPEGEGLGLVFLEASAAGLPVIAGDVAGVRDAVLHGTTGILTDPEDATKVSSAIVTLLRDHELCARMGAAGQEFVSKFRNADSFVDSIQALLDDLCLTKRRGH